MEGNRIHSTNQLCYGARIQHTLHEHAGELLEHLDNY